MSEQVPTSRVKHFQHLPSDWKLVRLDQIVSQKITYGIVQPGAFDSSGIPLIRGVDYMSGWGNLESFFRVSKDLHQKFKRSTTRKGDVLLSIAGYAGHVSVVPEWIEEANITQTSARISIEQSAASPPFVAYFLDSIEGKLQSRRYIKGSAQEGLNLDDVQKFLIPIPPLPEQKKIASILTSVDEVIEKTQSQIDKLQDLKKGTMNELLTKGIGHTEFKDSELGRIPKSWEVRSLDQISTFRRGSFPQPYGRPEWYSENGHPFVQVFDISHNNELKSSTKVRISDAAAEQSVFIPKGSLIVSLQGSIGRTAITQYDAYVDRTILIFLNYEDKLEVNFFSTIIKELFRKQKEVADGGIIKTITKETLRDFKITIPPLKEQTDISKVLGAIQSSIDNTFRKLESTQSLKKSLMQDLLTGKVRVSVN